MNTMALTLPLLIGAAYPVYTVKSFGTSLQLEFEISEGMNDNGALTGWVTENGLEQAAVIRFGVIQKLPFPARADGCTYNRSRALGINSTSAVVGWSTGPEPVCRIRATLWSNGVGAILPIPSDNGTMARVINDRGHIAGHENLHSWFYADGQVTWLEPLASQPSSDWNYPVTIHALNNADVVGGFVQTDSGYFAAIWRQGEPTLLTSLNGRRSEVLGLNDLGQAAGMISVGQNEEAVVWDTNTGNVTTLNIGQAIGTPYYASARCINNRGEVIGTMTNANTRFRGFFWNGGPTVRSLNALTQGTDTHSDNLAHAINRSGAILGSSMSGHVLLWSKTGALWP